MCSLWRDFVVLEPIAFRISYSSGTTFRNKIWKLVLHMPYPTPSLTCNSTSVSFKSILKSQSPLSAKASVDLNCLLSPSLNHRGFPRSMLSLQAEFTLDRQILHICWKDLSTLSYKMIQLITVFYLQPTSI